MAPLVWLVTGCSSGFGRAFAESIIAKGDKVIATARGDIETRLADLKKLGAATMELDVTAPQKVLDDKVAAAVQVHGRIDVLVNNAGYIEGGVLEEIDQELLLRGLTNNVLGPLNLTRAVVAHMRGRQSGTLIFMGSVGAYYGAPGSLTYCSGKGAIDSLVPTIAMEVAPWNIRACTLIPGYYRTNVMTPGNIQFRAPNPLPEYAEMNKLIQAGCYGADGNQPGDPRKAADVVVDAVHGDGLAAGKTLPARLPLGPDGIKAVRDNSAAKLAICDEWEAIVSATNVS